VVFVLGVIVQITVFRRLVHLSTSGEELEFRSLLACFGLMFIIQNVVGITGKWANWPPQIGTPYLYQTINILGERVQLNMIVAAVMSIFITGLMYFLLRSTRVGLAMRATVEEPTGAQLVGINIFKIHAVSFGLGALLSALAGSMLAMMSQNITPYTGPQYTFIALAVIILGGMGSFVGSLLGGFFIGYLYYTCLAIDALTVNIVIYAFLIIMLIIKPKGLFGK
jgi:branched-chain amino acid transport system permease protein